MPTSTSFWLAARRCCSRSHQTLTTRGRSHSSTCLRTPCNQPRNPLVGIACGDSPLVFALCLPKIPSSGFHQCNITLRSKLTTISIRQGQVRGSNRASAALDFSVNPFLKMPPFRLETVPLEFRRLFGVRACVESAHKTFDGCPHFESGL
jgi:hypothetical protein